MCVCEALGYSTKVYFNACCKPSELFNQDHRFLPYSIGPGHIATNMKEVLQVLINMCLDPAHGLSLVQKGPGPVLQAQTSSGETLLSTFTPPNKLSDYWTQLYAYAKLFQCCENFLSPGPPSCPCLLCHPFGRLPPPPPSLPPSLPPPSLPPSLPPHVLCVIVLYLLSPLVESFADSLAITDSTPPQSPHCSTNSCVLVDTATQLLQLQPNHAPDTPLTNIMETVEHIIVSHDEIVEGDSNGEVCVTEGGSPPPTGTQSVSCTHDTDGIQFVAYSGCEETPVAHSAQLRRSGRKRQHPSTSAANKVHLQSVTATMLITIYCFMFLVCNILFISLFSSSTL